MKTQISLSKAVRQEPLRLAVPRYEFRLCIQGALHVWSTCAAPETPQETLRAHPGPLPGVEKGPDGLKRGHGVGGEPAPASAEKKEENERRRQEHEV